jgi:hypothetical protein
MWRRIYLPLLLGATQATATFFAVYLRPDFRNLPDEVKLAMGAGFFFALVTPALAAWNANDARQQKLRSDAYAALLAALTKIAEEAGVPASEIGMSAYVVRRMLLDPATKVQARLARVRLASFPPASTIVWTRGKGFLGECWAKENMVIDRHIPTWYAQYLGCTEEEWEAAPPAFRLGLSFQEWEATQQRYRYIRVAPVLGERRDGKTRYLGCVSLDTGRDEHAAKLATDEVRDLLQNAANAIDAALRSPR